MAELKLVLPGQEPPAAPPKRNRTKRKPGEKVPWPNVAGGFIRYDAKGRPHYYIDRKRGERRWTIALKVHTEDAAIVELRKFEADPDGYLAGRGRDNALRFDESLRDAFFKWSAEERHNTPKWVAEQKRYLAWWVEELGDGCDLRRVDLGRDVMPALDGTPCRAPKIAVLKCFYSWLRTERHIIEPAEDPTFGKLKMPQNDPAQWKKVKAFTPEQFEKVRAAVGPGIYSDAMTVQAGTGWHVTELVRFARSGAVEELPPAADAPEPKPEGAVLVCPVTKGGEMLKTRVSKAVGDAARALLEAGTVNRRNYDTALREANEKAGLAPGTVSGGRFRHSIATWAVNAGTDPKDVASFLGHKSARTTRRFYATHAVPAKVPTLA